MLQLKSDILEKLMEKKMRFETVFYLLNMSQKADTSGLCGTEYHVWDESLHCMYPVMNPRFNIRFPLLTKTSLSEARIGK